MIAKRKTRSSGPAGLRSKTLSRYPDRTPKVFPADTEKLINELEAQNQELREKQGEIEEAGRRYRDLYDFAPIGYFILNREGTIIDLNLRATTLLGLSRNRLIGMPLSFFLPAFSLHEFNQYLEKVFASNQREVHEFSVNQKYQKNVAFVSMVSMALGTDKNATCRSALIDITERKMAEQEVIKARQELAERNAQLRRLSSHLFDVHEEERGRVAGDVHDSFASQLSAIKNELQLLLGKGEDERLNHVLNQLDIAIRDAIRIQKALRSPTLDDLGLTPTLNMLCREFENNYPHIHVEKQLFLEKEEIPDAIEVPVYRIAQEAFDNIAAHSGADLVVISLTRKDAFIEFAIRDNGQGFNVEEILTSGVGRGLSTMRERTVLSGGLFSIESETGKGTILRVSWPFA